MSAGETVSGLATATAWPAFGSSPIGWSSRSDSQMTSAESCHCTRLGSCG